MKYIFTILFFILIGIIGQIVLAQKSIHFKSNLYMRLEREVKNTGDSLLINRNWALCTYGRNIEITNKWRDDVISISNFLIVNEGIFEIACHSDCRGPEDYNEKFTKRLADQLVYDLLDLGVDHDKIISKGFGEKYLISGCKCEEGNECKEEDYKTDKRLVVKKVG